MMDPPSSRRFLLLLLRGIKRAGDVCDEMRSKRVLVSSFCADFEKEEKIQKRLLFC